MNYDEIAAYHEAGHVLQAHIAGGEVLESTLESEHDDHVGHTAVRWSGLDAEERAHRSGLVALAGPVAETLWRGGDVFDQDISPWRGDWDEANAALAIVAPDVERDAVRQQWITEIVRELRDPAAWEILCRIADALQAHGTLDRSLLEEILP